MRQYIFAPGAKVRKYRHFFVCEWVIEHEKHCAFLCVWVSVCSGSLRYSALLPHRSGIPVRSRAVWTEREKVSQWGYSYTPSIDKRDGGREGKWERKRHKGSNWDCGGLNIKHSYYRYEWLIVKNGCELSPDWFCRLGVKSINSIQLSQHHIKIHSTLIIFSQIVLTIVT